MVSFRTKYVVMCACFFALLSTSDLLGGQPVLYGRVFLATPRGNAILRDVRIRLLVPGTNDAKAQTYSDSNGRYAFYQVSAGSYEIQFLIGNSVLRQRVGNQKKERVAVQLAPGMSKLADVIVEK